MPDPIFAEPRVAAVYDPLDPDRSDLDAYESIVIDELRAGSVLDIGSGTGTFAIRLAQRGLEVTGLDPAAASVDVARGKPGAELVTWIVGYVADLPELQVDCVTMTANVAQVFLDDEWLGVLRAAYSALRPGGTLVFEARRPERQAWLRWTKENSHQVVEIPGVGPVEDWVQVTDVNGDQADAGEADHDGTVVTFESPTIFHSDGARYESTSVLKFRSRGVIESQLRQVGFTISDVRDAPDRPGYEWVYLATKPGHG